MLGLLFTPAAMKKLIGFCVLSFSLAAFSYGQEIPELSFPQDASVAADQFKIALQFRMDELAKYRELSSDGPETKAIVEPFLRRSIIRDADPEAESESAKEKLAKLAKAAMETGSKDPIFLSHAANFSFRMSDYAKALELGTESLEQFDQLKAYPDGMRFILLSRMIRMRITDRQYIHKVVGLSEKWRDEAARDLTQFLVYGSAIPDGLRETNKRMVDTARNCKIDTIAQLETFQAAIDRYKEREDHDPWLSEMGKAFFIYSIAWSHRGGGYAGDVEESGWEKFGELMPVAARHYRNAHELQPKFPEAADRLISIAKTGHAEKSIWYWFEQAVAAETDYAPAYSNIVSSLQPRWGGSIDQMIEFGRACIASDRYDTMVPFTLARLAIEIREEEGLTWEELFKRPGLFDDIMISCDGLLLDGDRIESERSEVLTTQICFAIAADELSYTATLWEELGDAPLDPAVLRRFDIQPEYDRSRCHAYQEYDKELREIRPMTGEMRVNPEVRQRVLKVYQTCADNSKDPLSKRYLDHWVKLLKMEQDFEDGKWVPLEFDRYNDNWLVRGNWSFNPDDSSMKLKTAGDGWRYLCHRARFPGPKEVHAEVATLQRVTRAFSMAVFIGLGQESTRFWSDSSRQTIGNGNGWTDGWYGIPGPISKERNQIRTKYWSPKAYEIWVDGLRYTINQGPRTEPPDQQHVGVGLFAPESSTGEGVIFNARVRKLTDPPLPRLSEHGKRIKYFSNLIKKHPKKDYYRFERGLEYYLTSQSKKAIADFEAASKRSPQEHDYHPYFGDLLVRAGRVKEGLAELERSKDSYAATRFLGQAMLAFHLATLEDDAFRDVKGATKILNTLHSSSIPTMESVLAQIAVEIETDKLDDAAEHLWVLPNADYNRAPHQKTYMPNRYVDAQMLAKKLLEKKEAAYEFTLLPLKGNPKTSTRAIKKTGIGLTTNDPFPYRPDAVGFNFPIFAPMLKGKPHGYAVVGKSKQAALDYSIESGHVVSEQQPVIIVDLYGRRLERKFMPFDNNIDVILFNGKKEVARKAKLSIPDESTPHVRCRFDDLKVGTELTNIKVVAKPVGKKKQFLFSLQEIRAAAISAGEGDAVEGDAAKNEQVEENEK